MVRRTFGWIQNPNRLETLKYVCGVFVYDSWSNRELIDRKLPMILNYSFITKENYDLFIKELTQDHIEISYNILKGKGSGLKSRKDALCTGIIQAAINGQKKIKLYDDNGNEIIIKKPYTDDWSADGYLRWAVSTGLLDYNEKKDTCRISELGLKLVKTENHSPEEKEIFAYALLSYPPVTRVLEILSDHQLKTKFELGSKLGFKEELGFTSFPQEIYVYDYCNSTGKEREKIRSNEEGDSDKYARTIANWLTQMEWVVSSRKTVTETYLGSTNTTELQAWQITREGEKALKKSKGYSSNKKIPKIVKFEMLASNKSGDASDYMRLRRAYILESLKSEKEISSINRYLNKLNISVSNQLIEDEIKNLENIGINITYRNNKYKLTDKIIGLTIPSDSIIRTDLIKMKDEIREKLDYINHDYLILIDLAYSNADTRSGKNSDAREFEIVTAKLLTEELDFSGLRLGDSNRPDIIIYYRDKGTIIDNKSYKDGFSLDKKNSDEMERYIIENQRRIPNIPLNEWWKAFDSNIEEFTFLFITSFLTGNYMNNLEHISATTGINGAVIDIENFLYLAESIKSEAITYEDFFKLFDNKQIIIKLKSFKEDNNHEE